MRGYAPLHGLAGVVLHRLSAHQAPPADRRRREELPSRAATRADPHPWIGGACNSVSVSILGGHGCTCRPLVHRATLIIALAKTGQPVACQVAVQNTTATARKIRAGPPKGPRDLGETCPRCCTCKPRADMHAVPRAVYKCFLHAGSHAIDDGVEAWGKTLAYSGALGRTLAMASDT